jgi:hypothetical protein
MGQKFNKQCTVQGTGRVPDIELRIGFQYMTAHCAQQLAKQLRQTGTSTCAKASMWHIQPELAESSSNNLLTESPTQHSQTRSQLLLVIITIIIITIVIFVVITIIISVTVTVTWFRVTVVIFAVITVIITIVIFAVITVVIFAVITIIITIIIL